MRIEASDMSKTLKFYAIARLSPDILIVIGENSVIIK
jgi:hypothetical protein